MATVFQSPQGLLQKSNVQKGAKGPATFISVGLGWDSPRDPLFGERLLLQPLTSGEKVGEGIEAGLLLGRGMQLIAELTRRTRWGKRGFGLGSGVWSREGRRPAGTAQSWGTQEDEALLGVEGPYN